MDEKKYKLGYCPGAFDLFHIGHLNLLTRSKERCEYLIAGVVTDELYIKYKQKMPCISFEERFAIVDALKCVDKTIAVDEEMDDKITAWHKLHYDCHFSGSDHEGQWGELIEEAHALGAEFEFFPYTQSTSSTRIRSIVESNTLFHYIFKEITDKTIVLFGTGRYFDDYMMKYGEKYTPAFAVDNEEAKWGTKKAGILIKSPKELLEIPREELWIFICIARYEEIEEQLKEMGITDYRRYSKVNKNALTIPEEYVLR